MKGKKILLGVTGGIAAYRVCDLIRELREKGAQVQVVMSENAKQFITPLTLEALSANRVYSDGFAIGDNVEPLHTKLAKSADLIVACPASADIMAKFSHGLANDLLSTIYLASQAPVLIVPAMNNHMYKHPATQANLEILKKRGNVFVEPIVGQLVCGDTDVGHLADQATIVSAIQSSLK